MHTKELNFEEQLLFKDNKINGRTEPNLGGFCVFKDAETGKILLAKKNLVVRNGRELTLRKIFNIARIPDNTTEIMKNKSILLFGIGNGGTAEGTPFMLNSPTYSPTPSDNNLRSEISFRTSSIAAPIPEFEANMYTDFRINQDIRYNSWYKKSFTNGNGEITINPATDETFVKLKLNITKDDARDKFVNELGLFFAEYDPLGSNMNEVYSKFDLFSRITFMTEPLPSNTSKALEIDYYVYL
jgi:hypothetical protein